MDKDALLALLQNIKTGNMLPEEAASKLSELPYQELGYAKIDHHRAIRTGYPEVVFGQGKSPEQLKGILNSLLNKENNILATRICPDLYESVKGLDSAIQYHPIARCITIRKKEPRLVPTSIAVVTAGTSDLPVAEEAAVTAEIFDNKVDRYFDVGVAGVHRLFDNLQQIKKARVIIVIAGMEGALPSIVGGLVDKPVIAVPTSVGYGANFGGLSALLGMLTSCASGISVVNIDNGFGAAYQASMINRL